MRKATGGQWRFELNVVASEPDVDDVIEIQSPLNETTSVSFRLANEFLNVSPFKAEFTSASSTAFTVHPHEGTLEPYGREGTPFVVGFTPTEYGAAQVGVLHITTDDMMWSYEIRGTHVEVQAPEGVAKVDDKLDPALLARLGTGRPKNFLKHNLKVANNVSPSRAGARDGRRLG